MRLSKTFVLVGMAVCAASTTPLLALPVQWPTTAGGNGHYYQSFLVPSGISWSDAKTAAEAAGGYLASITSSEENLFVSSLVNDDRYWHSTGGYGVGPWLGAFQPTGSPEPAGNWQWSSGEPFVYSNWLPGQPNNNGGNENFAHYAAQGAAQGAQWNDISNVPPSSWYIKGYLVESATASGPVRWQCSAGGNGHLYQAVLVPSGISWSDAKAAAEAAGGFLATIASAEENSFVYSLVSDNLYWHTAGGYAVGPWLGALQPNGSPEPDGNWGWVNGEPFTYSNWLPGQPNNNGGDENFAHFCGASNTMGPQWNDIRDVPPSSWYVNGYVMEFLPEPATMTLLGLGGLSMLVRRKMAK
jgi:hypothetical protein